MPEKDRGEADGADRSAQRLLQHQALIASFKKHPTMSVVGADRLDSFTNWFNGFDIGLGDLLQETFEPWVVEKLDLPTSIGWLDALANRRWDSDVDELSVEQVRDVVGAAVDLLLEYMALISLDGERTEPT